MNARVHMVHYSHPCMSGPASVAMCLSVHFGYLIWFGSPAYAGFCLNCCVAELSGIVGFRLNPDPQHLDSLPVLPREQAHQSNALHK